MTTTSNANAGADAIRFKLNGQDALAQPGETIIEAAQRYGVEIPHLCYMEGMDPDGNLFDISEHGYADVEYPLDRDVKQKETVR